MSLISCFAVHPCARAIRVEVLARFAGAAMAIAHRKVAFDFGVVLDHGVAIAAFVKHAA